MGRTEISAADDDAIREAVRAAELVSGAELVPVLAAASDGYAVADWRGVAAGALAGAVAGPHLERLLEPWLAWGLSSAWRAPAWVAAGALCGLLLALVPPIRRALAGAAELDRWVDAAAGAAFLRHEVFRTRDRTGILLYVSLFERRVRVLADEGVYGSVARPAWEQLARQVAEEMRSRSPAQALLEAVRRAGELVSTHGPRRRPDDVNELPDAPTAS